jgi:hypothetical protein
MTEKMHLGTIVTEACSKPKREMSAIRAKLRFIRVGLVGPVGIVAWLGDHAEPTRHNEHERALWS